MNAKNSHGEDTDAYICFRLRHAFKGSKVSNQQRLNVEKDDVKC